MGVKKYFIAIVIPAPLQEKVEAIKQDLFMRYGLKGALRSPAHITLHRPFEWKEEKEERLIAGLGRFQFLKTFEITLHGFDFFEPKVVYVNVLRNEILVELYTQLKQFAARELKLLNELADVRGFHPHVTVAFRDLKKPLFYELRKEFSDKRFSDTFNYQGFSLLRLEKNWEVIKTFDS